jgi:hypothetical protein
MVRWLRVAGFRFRAKPSMLTAELSAVSIGVDVA